MTEISFILPAYNEATHLTSAVRNIVESWASSSFTIEVLIVENGSSDSTWDEAVELANHYSTVRAFHLPEADYGAALRFGLLHADGRLVVNYDVDLTEVEFLERAMSVMDVTEAAIVVGSKRTRGSNDSRAYIRKVATWTYSSILRVGFGLSVTDTHGVKLMDRQAVLAIVPLCRFTRDLFDTELVLRAERSGLIVQEVPVQITDERPPRTKLTGRIPRTLLSLAKLRWYLSTE